MNILVETDYLDKNSRSYNTFYETRTLNPVRGAASVNHYGKALPYAIFCPNDLFILLMSPIPRSNREKLQ